MSNSGLQWFLLKTNGNCSALKNELKDSETVISFKNPDVLSKLLVRTDQELGGFSTAEVEVDEDRKIGIFHGNLNLDTPPNRPDIVYSGYAMFRTKDIPRGLFGGYNFWDWDHYHHVVLRVRGDHRKYIVNIQSRTPFLTDLHQHRLFLNDPGNWETVVIPIDDFVLTNRGVIQHQALMDRTAVKSIGIGILDNQYGPFKLEIDYIKVMVGDDIAKEMRRKREQEQVQENEVD